MFACGGEAARPRTQRLGERLSTFRTLSGRLVCVARLPYGFLSNRESILGNDRCVRLERIVSHVWVRTVRHACLSRRADDVRRARAIARDRTRDQTSNNTWTMDRGERICRIGTRELRETGAPRGATIICCVTSPFSFGSLTPRFRGSQHAPWARLTARLTGDCRALPLGAGPPQGRGRPCRCCRYAARCGWLRSAR